MITISDLLDFILLIQLSCQINMFSYFRKDILLFMDKNGPPANESAEGHRNRKDTILEMSSF